MTKVLITGSKEELKEKIVPVLDSLGVFFDEDEEIGEFIELTFALNRIDALIDVVNSETRTVSLLTVEAYGNMHLLDLDLEKISNQIKKGMGGANK